jgi:hypothetical protein
MATEKKMTKREKFALIAEIAEVKANPILAEFIDHEMELLARKNASGGEKKMTATQVANEGIKEVILAVLMDNGGMMTITDMQKANAELGELSTPKVSALVRQLKEDGKVVRTEDKRKAYFQAV